MEDTAPCLNGLDIVIHALAVFKGSFKALNCSLDGLSSLDPLLALDIGNNRLDIFHDSLGIGEAG